MAIACPMKSMPNCDARSKRSWRVNKNLGVRAGKSSFPCTRPDSIFNRSKLMAEANSKAEHLVGVDLGGTKILTGVFTSSLKIIGRSKMSTKAERGTASVIERIARCVQD